MDESVMLLGWVGPMVAIGGLFWNVARKLGHIEATVDELRNENRRLKSDVAALRDLLSVIVDARRATR